MPPQEAVNSRPAVWAGLLCEDLAAKYTHKKESASKGSGRSAHSLSIARKAPHYVLLDISGVWPGDSDLQLFAE
ncbi:MAG: hypothetical protein ACLU9S_14695 [Oscillospiraceae bacterium]